MSPLRRGRKIFLCYPFAKVVILVKPGIQFLTNPRNLRIPAYAAVTVTEFKDFYKRLSLTKRFFLPPPLTPQSSVETPLCSILFWTKLHLIRHIASTMAEWYRPDHPCE